MATATHSTIIGLFETRAAAEAAVNALLADGYARDLISIVSADNRNRTDIPDIGPKDEVGSGTDAGAGAAVGGMAGFIGGLVALAIPGIGPILAVGPLAAGIMGAGIGAAAGGMVGALQSYGVPENDASRFAEAIRHGRVMVSAQVMDDRAERASDIMEEHGAIDVDQPEEPLPTPTQGTETPLRPLSGKAVRSARLKPGEGQMDRQRERERRVTVYPGITGGGDTLPSA